MSISDPRLLRDALGCFLTGVTVITCREPDGTPRGFTANSFTSVSLDPPLLLVCIGKGAWSHDVFTEASSFAVNVLSEDQREISGLFASKSADKFDVASWREGTLNTPLLDNTLAWFECTPEQTIEAGDHTILIGRVAAFDHAPKRPLGYCRGNYVDLGLARSSSRDNESQVGAIIDHDGKVLMVRPDAGSQWTLPQTVGKTSEDDDATRESLVALFAELGVSVGPMFLFSIFKEADETNAIYYRGEVTGPHAQSETLRFFDSNDFPYGDLPHPSFETMVKRYFKERRELDFGVYVGSETAGTVTAFSTS